VEPIRMTTDFLLEECHALEKTLSGGDLVGGRFAGRGVGSALR
jgi:hypothetical protein